MPNLHDTLSNDIGKYVLDKIRTGDFAWQQNIFPSSLHRVGSWNWPRPDIVYQDNLSKITYAHEFKPPFQSKREYLTGLGQSLSYLQNHDYAGLIVPRLSDDNYPISVFINETLISNEFKNLPISLIEYEYDSSSINPIKSIKLLKAIALPRTSKVLHKAKIEKTFWAWWRDMSPYELFDLLCLSDKYSNKDGDIYTKYVYEEFYKMLITGNTKQWDGSPRHKTHSVSSFKAEKQNYKIPLTQLGFIDRAQGRLTKNGYRMLYIGKMYGAGSTVFWDCIAHSILIEGNHLDLINEIFHFQNLNKDTISDKETAFKLQLEGYLDVKGFIGPRKPGGVTTGAKGSYIRDEFKLWNKFNLLELKSKNYFFPNEGLKFNWPVIDRLLTNSYDYF